jgi:hypothetical protein
MVNLFGINARFKRLPLAFTGRRTLNVEAVRTPLTRILKYLEPPEVYVGMALGADTLCAQLCEELSIPFVACVPFPTQSAMWPAEQREEFSRLCSLASRVHTVSDHYWAGAMRTRNAYMVDNARLVLGVWDYSPGGGTVHALKYGRLKGRPVFIIDSETGTVRRAEETPDAL